MQNILLQYKNILLQKKLNITLTMDVTPKDLRLMTLLGSFNRNRQLLSYVVALLMEPDAQQKADVTILMTLWPMPMQKQHALRMEVDFVPKMNSWLTFAAEQVDNVTAMVFGPLPLPQIEILFVKRIVVITTQ